MTFRGLDGSGDWLFGAGISSYATKSEEIALNIKTRILSFLGDCFFDTEAGIDWWNRLDVGQKDNLDVELQDIIAKTDGVMSINSAYVYLNSQRQFIAKYDIIDIYTTNLTSEVEII